MIILFSKFKSLLNSANNLCQLKNLKTLKFQLYKINKKAVIINAKDKINL